MMKITSESRRTTQASTETNATMRKIAGTAKGLVTALGVGGGIAGGMALIVGQARAWATAMDHVADKGAEAGREMTALAMLAEEGKKKQTVLEAGRLGAQYGMSLGESWATYQGMTSLLGPTAGPIATGRAFRAAQTGMEIEDITKAIALGKGQGLTPWESITYPYLAGEASAYTPQTLIKAAPSMAFWQDKSLGWSAAVQLLKTIAPEQLETYLKAGGLGLSMEEGAAGDLWQKLGVKGAGKVEKLGALKGAGITSPEQLMGAGIGEIRRAQAISGLVATLDDLVSDARKITSQMREDYVWSKRLATEREVPQMALARESERLAAEHKMEMSVGPLAERELRSRIQRQETGAEMRYAGRGWMLNEETGEASRFMQFISQMLGEAGSRDYGAFRISQAQVDRVMEGLGGLKEAVQENTEAQRDVQRPGGREPGAWSGM